ncbi:MAG: prealbumin-like fold domain-containing protein [bacterium]
MSSFATGIAMCVVIGTIACGGDGSSVLTGAEKIASQTTGSGDSSHTNPGTSNGPVASVVVSPHALFLALGNYGHVIAVALDANGVAVVNKHATWRSSNANVVVASDTGVLRGNAVGTAKVYGTIDGHEDSLTVIVAAGSNPTDSTHTDSTHTDSTSHGTTVPVASFNLSLTVRGSLSASDTLQTEAVAGARVTLTRTMGIHGDTLNPAVLVATLTTDEHGVASMQNVPGGTYHLVATAPAGSPYLVTSAGIFSPSVSEVQVAMLMLRAP